MKLGTLLLSATVVLMLTAQRSSSQTRTSQDEDETRTWITIGNMKYHADNGRIWKVLDKQSRIMYLIGVEEGVNLLLMQTSGTPSTQAAAKSLMISGFRFSDLVEQIDRVYEDSANGRIPVIEAYKYTLAKLRGAPNPELEALLSDLRRKYNQ